MKALIYPYRAEYDYFVDALKIYRTDLEITSVVIPQSYAKYCPIPVNVKNYTKFDDALQQVECVVFLPMDNFDLLHKRASQVLEEGKKVILSSAIPKEQVKLLKELANFNNTSIEYQDKTEITEYLKNRSDIFTQQESVVIGIGSLTQGISTSKIAVKLCNELSNRGYSVSIIGTSPELAALNIDILPLDEMIQTDLDDTIVQINRFANLFQLRNRPNIVILQLPNEGLYRVSSDYSTCFGAKTFLVSQAIDIDYCVMVTPYMDMDADVFSELSDISEKRYGFRYDALCFAHRIVDMQWAAGETELRYYLAESKGVKETVSRLRKEDASRIYIDSADEWYSCVADDIIEQLSQ